ncbi:MAG: (d)CMP kinase [Defluviitaleaceae bacterium]|nr:(d)CMP kinase [Defluviitaleaceae bacterium]
MNQILTPTQIAIDGPSGAGKSTVARLVAERAGFFYVDSGAVYRAVALAYYNHCDDLGSVTDEILTDILSRTEIIVQNSQNTQKTILNGKDVMDTIRTPKIAMAASALAAYTPVRRFVTDTVRTVAAKESVVIDGRDIGTKVLPNANLKIYLDASPEIRARRRFDELQAAGKNVVYSDVLNDVITRDHNDSTRALDPLRKANDAVTLLTDNLTINDVIDKILSHLKEITA